MAGESSPLGLSSSAQYKWKIMSDWDGDHEHGLYALWFMFSYEVFLCIHQFYLMLHMMGGQPGLFNVFMQNVMKQF